MNILSNTKIYKGMQRYTASFIALNYFNTWKSIRLIIRVKKKFPITDVYLKKKHTTVTL